MDGWIHTLVFRISQQYPILINPGQ